MFHHGTVPEAKGEYDQDYILPVTHVPVYTESILPVTQNLCREKIQFNKLLICSHLSSCT